MVACVKERPEFRAFVLARQARLLQFAWFITGDYHHAEDLVQIALAKLYLRWEGIVGDPDPYVRAVLVNAHISLSRRRWRQREMPSDRLPEVLLSDETAVIDTRAVVRKALLGLPIKQRAVIVLRYFDDYSERDAAVVLGCSVGTVKSQTAKALAKLRADQQLTTIALEKAEFS